MNEVNFLVKSSSSVEVRNFFSSLNELNEEKYISALKNSSLKIWTYLNEDGLTSLHFSISLKLFELSEEIIKSAKKYLSQEDFISFINYKTNKGQTPLHYASFVGYITLIKLLIQNGADPFLKTNNGFNVLHLAIIGNKITSFFYFIKKYRIDINSKDIKENTGLHLAVYFNSYKIFNYLLTNNKIDVNALNKEGITPLHFAVMSQNKSMIKKLLIKGADCNIKNKKLISAYDLANKNNYVSIKNILKSNKCKYIILMFSNFTKFFLILLGFLPFLILFYFNFDYKIIVCLLWIIVYIYFIIRFLKVDPFNFNSKKNYLLNLIDVEEKSIEDYCIKCQTKQKCNTVHCLICNKCIEGFDHHCFWINKCVGERNKAKFYHLIWVIEIHVVINFFLSILILPKNKKKMLEYYNKKDILIIIIIGMNTLILILATIIICPLIKFYYYQSRDKTKNKIVNDERKNEKLLNKLDEENIV